MDRNDTVQIVVVVVNASLSARRAWIEMFSVREVFANFDLCTFAVALRKESVDRNINCNSNFTQKKQSLSARRAWIEMRRRTHRRGLSPRRSPQGERG